MEDPSFSSDRVREAHCRVNVTCGDKTGTCLLKVPTIDSNLPQRPPCACCFVGCFVGGHWDRKHKQQSDVWVVCFCCQQRLLCRDFECHAGPLLHLCCLSAVLAPLRCTVLTGRQAARSWQTSTKVADQSCANLGEWIRRECHKIGNRAVGQRISVWLPSKRLTQLGTVTQYNDEDKEHTILYCDGTEERLYLAVEAYKLEGQNAIYCMQACRNGLCKLLPVCTGDAKGPRRQERRTGAVVEEDASSVSAPRKRSSGLRNAQQAQAANTYTAASALLGMSHSQSKRQQTLNSHFLSQAAPTDTGE